MKRKATAKANPKSFFEKWEAVIKAIPLAKRKPKKKP